MKPPTNPAPLQFPHSICFLPLHIQRSRVKLTIPPTRWRLTRGLSSRIKNKEGQKDRHVSKSAFLKMREQVSAARDSQYCPRRCPFRWNSELTHTANKSRRLWTVHWRDPQGSHRRLYIENTRLHLRVDITHEMKPLLDQIVSFQWGNQHVNCV